MILAINGNIWSIWPQFFDAQSPKMCQRIKTSNMAWNFAAILVIFLIPLAVKAESCSDCRPSLRQCCPTDNQGSLEPNEPGTKCNYLIPYSALEVQDSGDSVSCLWPVIKAMKLSCKCQYFCIHRFSAKNSLRSWNKLCQRMHVDNALRSRLRDWLGNTARNGHMR